MSSDRNNWLWLGILALVGALIYLPLANKLGLYKDDWFLVFDAHTQGSQFFHEIYASDRPARAYLMQAIYGVFGDHIFYYHLSAYLFRVLSAWSLFWALDMVWAQEKKSSFLTALLFLIYPGFLSQVNSFDYQAQILSLCLAMASIAFTLKALKSEGLYKKLLWFGLSIVSSLIYPALVDYFLGLEVLRLGLIVNLTLQNRSVRPREFIAKVMYRWTPFLIAPLIFIIWRFFFFTTERRATDASVQVGQLFTSPMTGLRWLVTWSQDAVKVLFLAWSVPLNNLVLNLRLGDLLVGVVICALVSVLAVAGYYGFRLAAIKETAQPFDLDWRRQTLITGSVTAIFALLPVIVANRHADFGEYSRYTLASAAGAALFLTAFLATINSPRLRLTLVALLVFMAGFVHYANAVQAVQETETIQKFWWQVAWRAPGFKPGTTLVASYPTAIGIQEDYFIWGPANLIYYPENQHKIPIDIKLPAAVLTSDTVNQIVMGKGKESPLRRGNYLTRDFGNILVISQAGENTCVRILGEGMNELSISDEDRIKLISPNSKIDDVIVQGSAPQPSALIFGDEPPHNWCFYYQKASLARQQGDWQKVAQLGNEAQKLGLHPNDQLEWMPFLQAYAILGDQKQVKGISTRINTEPYYQVQACENFGALAQAGSPLSPEMQSSVDELFCK
ncbi:MAG: hypothetical protein ABI904_07370 [Chloroflexota bacterium]